MISRRQLGMGTFRVKLKAAEMSCKVVTVEGETGDWMKLPSWRKEKGQRWPRIRPWGTPTLGKLRRK